MFCWVELATQRRGGGEEVLRRIVRVVLRRDADGRRPGVHLCKSAGRHGRCDVREQGHPANWLVYVSVDSADDTAAKAKSLGAKLKAEPFDVFDAGRMAMIHDPEGATFAIWQPKKHRRHGVRRAWHVCWNELMARDGDGERTFYTSLFGWTAKVSPEYTEWHDGEKARGGFLEMKDRASKAFRRTG